MRDKLVQYFCMVAIAFLAALYICALIPVFTDSSPHYPTYRQVCAPLNFYRMVDYGHDRTFVVCGSATTEPVLREVKPLP